GLLPELSSRSVRATCPVPSIWPCLPRPTPPPPPPRPPKPFVSRPTVEISFCSPARTPSKSPTDLSSSFSSRALRWAGVSPGYWPTPPAQSPESSMPPTPPGRSWPQPSCAPPPAVPTPPGIWPPSPRTPPPAMPPPPPPPPAPDMSDRKSTRLNSSHVKISYAVFCLKKKNTIPERSSRNLFTSDFHFAVSEKCEIRSAKTTTKDAFTYVRTARKKHRPNAARPFQRYH